MSRVNFGTSRKLKVFAILQTEVYSILNTPPFRAVKIVAESIPAVSSLLIRSPLSP
jgi:hypothetical protein